MSYRNVQQNTQDRPWVAIRFGSAHPQIRRQNVENYIRRLYGLLNQRGVNLRPRPTVDIINTNDYIEARQSIERLRDECSASKKVPLLLFIDDSRDHIVEDFVDDIFIFETRGDELEEMLHSDNFTEAEGWCDEFVQEYIPIEPTYIPSTSTNLPPTEQRNTEKSISNGNFTINDSQVSRLESYNQDASASLSKYNHRDNQEFESDRSINNRTPVKNYQHSEINNSYSNYAKPKEYPQEREVSTKPIVYNAEEQEIVSFDIVKTALEEFDQLPADQQDDFIGFIAGICLFNRLSNPFVVFDQNVKLLELLVKSLESAFTRPNLECAKTLLVEMAERGFLIKLIQQARDYCLDDPLYTLKLLMKVFLKVLEVIQQKDQSYFQTSWNLFLKLLNSVPHNIWDHHPEAQSWFEKSVDKIEGKVKEEVAKPNYQQNKDIFYDAPSEFYPQPYIESETKEPPEDFRTISAFPTKRDVLSSPSIYLRRSIIQGPYKDAEHYLDIQFRLFREDLVSPLRDGLSIHKMTGTSRYNRISKVGEDGVEISDVIMFDVQQVKGIQARFNHGENIRYIQLVTNSFLESVANRHLKYGQMVALSSDQFMSDVHIGIIIERNDNELLSNGLLGIHFISDDGLEMKKGYVLAEPASYLEMYSHVLKVMQSVNQFAPLPMERYLVQTKMNRRRPRYLRYLQNEEDEEDEKLEKMYLEKLYRKRGQRVSNEDDERGLKFELTDMIVKRKRIGLAEPRNREYMKIRGKTYKVENLEEELDLEDYDPSQRRALISALTSELALIQGPPGTGKTFIGVEIVRTILENNIQYGISEPILLVCYTNAALDQFLEKILDKVSTDVEEKRYAHDGPVAVRLGLKSDSSTLERAGVMKKDVVARYKTDYALDEEQEVGSKSKQKRLAAASLATASYIASQEAQSEILAYEALKDTIPPNAANELLMWSTGKRDSRQEKLAMDEVLACWLLDKSLESGSADMFPLTNDDDKDELERSNPRRPVADDEDNIPLDVVFQQMNKIADEHQARLRELWNKRDEFEKQYETEDKWDILKKELAMTKNVVIFGDGGNKRIMDHRRIIEIPHDQIIVNELNGEKDNIIKTTPLTQKEAEDIRSIYGLPKQRRWQLYNYWALKLRAKVKEQIPGFMKNYQTACEKTHKALKRLDAAILSKSLIIGATTTGAAKFRDLLELIGCRIIIIEEAAEVLEAHTFASLLPTIEHVVLIGDHQQLRPNPSVYELACTYNMEVSLFERLIKNGAPFNTLEKQHRMHPDITKTLVRPHFYNMLKDAEEVKEYREVLGMNQRLFFWTHSCQENTGFDGVSYSNQTEIEMVISLLQYVIKQGYGLSDVTVIATYSAQKVLTKFGATSGNNGPAIAVETVDSFQGKENKILIVSLVRSQGPTIGFLKTANRICVALTRAKHGMYIIGNAEHLASKSELWHKINTSLQAAKSVGNSFPIKCRPHGTIQHIRSPSEFAIKSPDGGCDALCGFVLSCGHKCGRNCHPIDDHTFYRCQASCNRRCNNKEFLHECSRRCFEECGLCQQVETITLKCGHVTNVPCHAAEKAQCVEQCEEILNCNHRCREVCSRPCKTYCEEDIDIDFPCGHVLITACHNRKRELKCTSTCDQELPCGHLCQELCGDICTIKCMTDVERTLSCGHPKVMPCSRNPLTEVFNRNCSKQCILCTRKCDNSCLHRACQRQCYEVCDVKPCDQTCSSQLKCSHACLGMCGEVCPDICGTCSRKAYKSLIIRNNMNENEFHHLISIPLCGHIVPVQILDDYVTQLQEEKTMPRCPVCEGSLNGVKRYAKIVKKAALDAYFIKEKGCNDACSTHTVLLESKMAVKAMQKLQVKNTQKEYKTYRNILDLTPLSNLIKNITTDIEQEIAKGTKKLAVLKDLALFLQCLCEMYSAVWDCCRDYGKNVTGPSNFTEWIDSFIFKRQIFGYTRTTLEDCRSDLEVKSKSQLRGAIVPYARYLFYKVLFNLTIWKFAQFYTKSTERKLSFAQTNQADLTSNQVRELKNLTKNFKQCTYGDDYAKQYTRFLNYLNEKVLSAESQIKFDFVLPDF